MHTFLSEKADIQVQGTDKQQAPGYNTKLKGVGVRMCLAHIPAAGRQPDTPTPAQQLQHVQFRNLAAPPARSAMH